jgi:hypothetical protein
MAEVRQKPQNSYGGVDVQAGSEADGDKKCEQLSRRDFEDIEHQRGVRPWVLELTQLLLQRGNLSAKT